MLWMRIPSLSIVVLFPAFLAGRGHAAEPVTLRIKDHLAHRWTDELLTYRLTFESGAFRPGRLRLLDEKGLSIPLQLTETKLNKDGSLASASVSFILSELPASGERVLQLSGEGKTGSHTTDLSAKGKGGVLELTTSKVGIRLLAGTKQFEPALPAKTAPAPILGIRLRSGEWIGRAWWEAERPCTGYQTETTASGPVFAEARVRMTFADDKHYAATYRVIAGQDVVLVQEEFNLGDPKRYVIPDYDEKYRSQWDWWGHVRGDASSLNNLFFSFYDGKHFAPDSARWHGHPSPTPGKGFEYKLDFSANRLQNLLNPYLQWSADESLFFTTFNSQDHRDAVAVLPTRPSQWVHPDIQPHEPSFLKQLVGSNSLGVWSSPAPDLYLRAPVNMGKRTFLIASLDAKTDVAAKMGDFDRTGELHVKYAQRPLDKVKDWVLEWPETTKRPMVFCMPGDLEAMQKRAHSWEHTDAGPGMGVGGPVYSYLITGNEAEAMKYFETGVAGLLKRRDQTLRGYGEPTQHQGWGWGMHIEGPRMDVALAASGLSPEQRREARALMAYTQYCAWDPDHFPGRVQGFAWGSANQGSIIMTARALWGRVLADHPMAKQWAADGAKFAVWDFERFLHPESGAAQDCIGYSTVVICQNLAVLQALQDMVDISPILPRLRALADWRLITMPPPDPRFGIRTQVTLGDTPYFEDTSLGLLGMTLLKTDPELARQCLWGYRACAGQRAGMVDAPLVVDNSLPDQPANLRSKHFPGFGAVLRTGTRAPEETYLCYYHGNFAWGHHHWDQGTLVLYAKGAPLMLDFGSMYQPNIRQACFHNTLTFNHLETDELRPCPGRDHKDCFYTGEPYFAHDKEPFSFLQYSLDAVGEGPTGGLGEVREFATQPHADYARGEQRFSSFTIMPYRYDLPHCYNFGPTSEAKKVQVTPFVWSRQVVLVKDENPFGPNYFFVHDDLTGNEKLEPAFNLWSLTKEVQMEKDRAFLPGQWGVDLDVFIAEPSQARTAVREVAHGNGSIYGGRFSMLHKRPFEERQKLLRIFGKPGGEGFGVLVYPRTVKDPRPEFAALKGVPGVKVTLPDQTHWVIASREEVTVKEAGFAFTGTAAIIKQFNDGRAQLSLLAPGKIEYGKVVLESPNTASLEVRR